MTQVYVVWWQYGDKSGCDFVKAFASEDEAIAMKELLDKHGGDGRNYEVTVVPFQENY